MPQPQCSDPSEFCLTIREYLAAQRQAGRAPSTVEKYRYHLVRLAGWLKARGVDQPGKVPKVLLREWGASLYEAWSPATVKQAVSVARSFFGWCREEELIDTPLASALRVPRVKRRVQRTLSAAEIGALLSVCDPLSGMGKRDIAVITLMLDSGLRASELCRLRVDQVQVGALVVGQPVNVVSVIGKGGNEDYAYFGDRTAENLLAWLEVRLARPGVEELFVSVGGIKPGERLTRFGLRDLLKRIGRLAGIEGVSPHCLRRSFAVLADEAGASTRKIQQWGRWSDIHMVERYTQALQAGRYFKEYSPVDHLYRTG